jgi:hypothetical protein
MFSTPSVPPPPGRVVASFADQGSSKVTDVAFDGTRMAWLTTRHDRPIGAAVRQVHGGPVLRVSFQPGGTCRHPGICDQPGHFLVLAGTQLAFEDGFAGNTEYSTQLYVASAPGRTHDVTSWYEMGTDTASVWPWVSYAGQGNVLAYTTQTGELRLFDRTQSRTIATGVAQVLAVNRRRIVVETQDHGAALVDPDGGGLRSLPAVALGTPGTVSAARAAGLQGDDLVVAGDRTLVDYDASNGTLRTVYRFPVAALAVSVNRGVAAYVPDQEPARIYLIDLSDGSRARITMPQAWTWSATLTSRGLDYGYRTAHSFVVREIGWPELQRDLG